MVLYSFMDELVKRGHEVYAVLPDQRLRWEPGIWKDRVKITTKPSILRRVVKPIVRVSPVYSLFKKYQPYLYLYRLTRGLIRNWADSDVTIATYCLTAYAAYYLSDKTVPIYHMQHFEEISFPDKLQRLIVRNTYKLPLIKVANSIWLKNLIRKHFHDEPYLLNPGIDLNVFRSYKEPKEKYYDKKDWLVVSYFDETREWKGFGDAVKAVSIAREKLIRKNVNIKWKVYGLRPPTNRYDVEFEYVGKIFGEELAALYSGADIVLLTSWYESFPLPPIEAMACGSLVITTRYGTEDYVANGVNGLVSPPREVETMANKIAYAIENPGECTRMVQNALDTCKNFTWPKRTDVLEEILHEVINEYTFNKVNFFDDLVGGKFKDYMHEEFELHQ